jgi:APA family basic amino acid/polyamine antiporter
VSPEVFARKATGFVREMSPLAFFIYVFMCYGLGPGIGLIYVWSFFAYPAANWGLAMLICTIGSLFHTLTIAMVVSIFPRSGPDYVVQSRILHPALAMMATFQQWIFWQFVWYAIEGYSLNSMAFSPFLSALGFATGNAGLSSLATWITSPASNTIMSMILVWGVALVFVFGMKLFVKIQWGLMLFALLGTILVILALATTTPTTFAPLLGQYMGDPNAYNAIIGAAKTAGFNPSPPFSLSDTFVVTAIPFFLLLWAGAGTPVMGEVKNANNLKNMLLAIVGAFLLLAFMLTLVGQMLINSVGKDFLGAAGYLYFTGASVQLPVAPYYNLFPSIIVAKWPGGSLILVLIMLGFVAWTLNWPFNSMFGYTRYSVAYSFDRIYPEKMGAVSERYHTPLYALFTLGIGASAMYVLYYLGFYAFTYASIVGGIFCFLFTTISGAILPWRDRELYNSWPGAKYKIGPVPLITVTGVLGTIWLLIQMYLYLTIPALGVYNIPSLAAIIASILLGLVVYYAYRWYRKRQGFDISLAFKQIPYE